ncbi:DsbE family thiol:disulfide interchange protein [Aromatoleum diolicum]|uniref:DsbE family thiol:disulfide interchange protein n=1 Tax=Aromatoleum diolicum TaxID=75796 RepID=A0ABX1QFC9_9RHOO|nr:DsbE family thiol:disulfide interchange protein [Aromatoleum diolicum]NMG75716.1 DsbE family thiol:disulfide interchange protein [Aromatoleum diolicum]
MKAKFLVPLFIFLLLAGFLGYGLKLNPRELPSVLIDKPAPQFRLAQLSAPDVAIANADMRGQVWLLNVWASWCVACRQEHPVLNGFSRQKVVPLIGLNYKDGADDAKAWLREHGDPYDTSLVDADGRVGIDFGVYGVPETFLIDQAGVIRYKHIGPVTPEAVRDVLLPKIAELKRAG